ncbi:Uncharacterised protein [uncultured archaeon]|nr:Uncharacterised protein [uncultured archaeon]
MAIDRQTAIRAASILLLLCLFYSIGLPLEAVAALGAISAAMLALRGPMQKFMEKELFRRFPLLEGLPGWAKTAITLLLFILALYCIKLAVYWLLALAGFDLQAMMLARMQASILSSCPSCDPGSSA